MNSRKQSARTTAAPSTLVARIAQLPSLPMAEIKQLWRQLFDGDTPTHNRQFLERRIAHRMQELECMKAAAELKKQATAALVAVQQRSDVLLSELKTKYKIVDEAHTAALWTRVRELFDYPVFVAAPKTVGITSTGETGDGVANELPDLLRAYREFEAWIDSGAQPEAAPNFPVPSTA